MTIKVTTDMATKITSNLTTRKSVKYSAGFAATAICAVSHEYALGLLALYYSVRQVKKLSSLMS